jgi:hypothetical protein
MRQNLVITLPLHEVKEWGSYTLILIKMKTIKSTIMSAMTFTLLLAFTSCEKEELVKNTAGTSVETSLIIRPISDQNRTGEDEEEEVIMGNLEDGNGLGIPNITIDLLTNSDSTITDSNATSGTGAFQLSGPSGAYLFRINLTSGSIFSESFILDQNMQILIQI